MTALESSSLDQFAAKLHADGPAAAVDDLIAELRRSGDYHSLFYALLMKARVALGVSPFPMGPAADLPAEVHEPYEEAIRTAARDVGNLYLAQNDLPRAWGFYRLIGEPQPVKEALDAIQPGPDHDIYPLIDIAWHQKLHPRRGFDLILERHGVCSAITTLSGSDLSNDVPLRLACIRLLIKALHDQLRDRLGNDFANRGLGEPGTIAEMLRPELFAEDAYHVDVSHLASVAQMSLELPPGDASLPTARELCEYGQRLSPGFRGAGEPPFEEPYHDYGVYLGILAGENSEAGIEHFEKKAESGIAEGNTFPAEVFINLLLRLDRQPEALAAAKRLLAGVTDDSGLSCPGIGELARRAGDYAALADAARAKGDAVTFLAGLIAGNHRG